MTGRNRNHGDSRKDLSDVEARILAEADSADVKLHAVFRTGEEFSERDETDNWDVDYYLALYEDTYEGKEYLKMRYFAAHKHDKSQDTFLKNGINIRIASDDEAFDLDELPPKLGRAIVAAYNGRDEVDRDVYDFGTGA